MSIESQQPNGAWPIHVYWSSGAGNSLLAAVALVERLRELGKNAELRAIERFDPYEIDPNAMIGLVFPTHFFTVPEMVRQFAELLPNVAGTHAFMVNTVGVTSCGGVHGPLKRIMTEKGFQCLAAKELVMPDSFFAFVHGRPAHWLIRRAMTKVRSFADQLVDEKNKKNKWRRIPVITDWWAFFMRRFFACRNLFAPWFRYPVVYARSNPCTRCGKCAKYCPVSALSMQSLEEANPEHDDLERKQVRRSTKQLKSAPEPNMACTLCLRCVSVCPHNAMRMRLLMLPPYRPNDAKNMMQLFDDQG